MSDEDVLKKRSLLHRKSSMSKSRKSYVRQTPKTVELGLNSAENGNTEILPDIDITYTSWKTFRVTALFDFSYKKDKLKEYSKHLGTFIEKEEKKNVGVLFEEEKKSYTVTFSVQNGINRSEADSKALKIEIIPKSEEGIKSPLFVGIFASVERTIEPWETELETKCFRVLPLFLTRGTQFYLKSVVSFFENRFSCTIQPLTFTNVHLTWMLAMWAGTKRENPISQRGLKPLQLEYSLPSEDLSTIKYQIDGKSVYRLWNRIHDADSNEMDQDEVNAFINCLEKHFFETFKINLSSCAHLASVGTNAVVIHRNGIVKIFNKDAVLYVLRHLTRLAQELTIT